MSKSKTTLLAVAGAYLLGLAAGCSHGSSGSDGPAGPVVLTNSPLHESIDVPVNAPMKVTFSGPMDSATINDTNFTVTEDPNATPVAGTVIYSDSAASFWPTAHLDADASYTATITRGAENAAGIPLQARHTWQFTTGITNEPGHGVELGRSGDFAILAKAAISTVPASAITGDIGVSPAAATFLTGFALSLDASNQFSTSTQVTGSVYAADYAPPTPAFLTDSVLDMQMAFTDAAGRAPDETELGAGNIGGMTLVPGVYKWGTGLLIPTDVTLSGGATDVWIFQIAQDLTVSSGTSLILAGGALPENVYWQVSGLVDLGTTSQFSGAILCATSVTLQTGASVHGRLLAQTAVSLDAATVVEP